MANGRFPEGKSLAVVTSWDDGTATDRLMYRMLDKYGWKGTFYVCSDWIGREGYLNEAELRELLAAGHEIGAHSVDHPHLETLSPAECARQVIECKTALDGRFGTSVLSFAYPYGFGHGEAAVAEAVRQAGYASARTTENREILTADALLQGDWMQLPVSAYFTEDFPTIQEKWDAVQEADGGIFHLWGHSVELGGDTDEWVDFECILGYIGGMSDVWYGTVGELIAHLRSGL